MTRFFFLFQPVESHISATLLLVDTQGESHGKKHSACEVGQPVDLVLTEQVRLEQTCQEGVELRA